MAAEQAARVAEDHRDSILRDLNAILLEMSRVADQAKQAHYQPVIDDLQRRLTDRQRELDYQQGRLADLRAAVEHKETVIERAADHLGRMRLKDQAANLRCAVFKGWLAESDNRAKTREWLRRTMLRVPSMLYFKRWSRRFRKRHIRHAEQEAAAQSRADIARFEQLEAERVTKLDRELQECVQQQAREETARAAAIDNLKRAFMRGVTSISVEAQEIFGSGLVQGQRPAVAPKPAAGVRSAAPPPRGRRSSSDDEFTIEQPARVHVVRHWA